MARLAAVLLIGAAMFLIRRIEAPADILVPNSALALGFTLAVALVAGDVLRRFRLPKLTGYLLFGILAGPYLGNVITEPMARQLQTITGTATALIAFIAGLMLNFGRLRRRQDGVVRMTFVTLSVAALGLALVIGSLWRGLPIAPDATGVTKAIIVALLVVIMISFSPTMTAAVIAETDARGRFSELVLAIVVLADLVVLAGFSVLMQLARVSLGPGATSEISPVIRLLWEIVGALAFGSLVGALFALYLRYFGRAVTLVLLGMCVLLSQVGRNQGFEPLLAAVAAGLVVENVAVAQGDALKGAIQNGALPLLIVFFVSVGASLRLDALQSFGPIALLLGVLRVALIRAGTFLGSKGGGREQQAVPYLWTGLISQAGITLGLSAAVAAEFPAWGGQVQALVVALIAFDELVGPLVFRIGLGMAGELDSQARPPLIVVSSREPYLHNLEPDGRITVTHAAGGVAVALDALMRERDGVWIAHGAGTADRAVTDAGGKVWVPPESPSYQLRRLWFDPAMFARYYGGFSNEGLWPLCHQVDVRPKFRSEDWAAYTAINGQFAAGIAEELQHADTPVFIQDYHLAVVTPALRKLVPQAHTALFWHIPWPSPDRLRICPWRREILEGLLANDLLAFQVERDRRNFLLAAREELRAEIEADEASVRFAGKSTAVVAVPIGVDYDRIQSVITEAGVAEEQQRMTREFGLTAGIIGLGVDRLDYTKGIPERLDALDRLLTRRPDLCGRLSFVQVGVRSRSDLQSYIDVESAIDERVAQLNRCHGRPGQPPPVYYHKGTLGLVSLVALYRMAHFCVVSSLADGMNLVAKEFVAARDDEDGVLVLSNLTGAAQELSDALIVNPYDLDGFADALLRAISMPPDERRARMRAMRRVVAGRDVFAWAFDILQGLESLWTRPLHYAARAPEEVPV